MFIPTMSWNVTCNLGRKGRNWSLLLTEGISYVEILHWSDNWQFLWLRGFGIDHNLKDFYGTVNSLVQD